MLTRILCPAGTRYATWSKEKSTLNTSPGVRGVAMSKPFRCARLKTPYVILVDAPSG